LATVKRTARAEIDLIEIWLHVAQDNQDEADKLLDSIDLACERLAENPQMGPPRPDLAAELRYSSSGGISSCIAPRAPVLKLSASYMAHGTFRT